MDAVQNERLPVSLPSLPSPFASTAGPVGRQTSGTVDGGVEMLRSSHGGGGSSCGGSSSPKWTARCVTRRCDTKGTLFSEDELWHHRSVKFGHYGCQAIRSLKWLGRPKKWVCVCVCGCVCFPIFRVRSPGPGALAGSLSGASPVV